MPDGARPQHRQRDPRRLPRLRHHGRDRGDRDRRHRRDRGAARRAEGAAMNSLILSTADPGADAADPRAVGLRLLPRPQRARRRLHRRPAGGHRLRAAREGRGARRRAPGAALPPAVDRRGRPRLRARLRRLGRPRRRRTSSRASGRSSPSTPPAASTGCRSARSRSSTSGSTSWCSARSAASSSRSRRWWRPRRTRGTERWRSCSRS